MYVPVDRIDLQMYAFYSFKILSGLYSNFTFVICSHTLSSIDSVSPGNSLSGLNICDIESSSRGHNGSVGLHIRSIEDAISKELLTMNGCSKMTVRQGGTMTRVVRQTEWKILILSFLLFLLTAFIISVQNILNCKLLAKVNLLLKCQSHDYSGN